MSLRLKMLVVASSLAILAVLGCASQSDLEAVQVQLAAAQADLDAAVQRLQALEKPTARSLGTLRENAKQTEESVQRLQDAVEGIAQAVTSVEESVDRADVEESVDRADVKRAVVRVYQLINEQRWLDVWESYTPEFRRECPYIPFVNKYSPVSRYRFVEITRFEDITLFSDSAATARFNAAYSVSGGGKTSYDYTVMLQKVGDDWLRIGNNRLRQENC